MFKCWLKIYFFRFNSLSQGCIFLVLLLELKMNFFSQRFTEPLRGQKHVFCLFLQLYYIHYEQCDLLLHEGYIDSVDSRFCPYTGEYGSVKTCILPTLLHQSIFQIFRTLKNADRKKTFCIHRGFLVSFPFSGSTHFHETHDYTYLKTAV